jgi:hypothetical protein
MTLVLRTTDHPTEAPPAPPATPVGSDPLLQLRYENRDGSGPHALRYIRHPQEIALRGIPVMCPACRARRDWLLMNEGRNTWVFCRCGTEWHEPEITRAAFEALTRLPDTTAYTSVEQALAAMGFDGGFAGIYLE